MANGGSGIFAMDISNVINKVLLSSSQPSVGSAIIKEVKKIEKISENKVFCLVSIPL